MDLTINNKGEDHSFGVAPWTATVPSDGFHMAVAGFILLVQQTSSVSSVTFNIGDLQVH